MLILASTTVKKRFLFPRFYQTTSRYDGYWTLLLQSPSPPTLNKTIPIHDACLDTTNNDHDAITSDATPIGDAPAETTTTDQTTPPVTSFVWLRNEKIPVPTKPPPPENCCMSGCAYCVYDIYQEDMETYKQQMIDLRQRFDNAGVDIPDALMTKKMKSSTSDPQPDDDDDMDPTMKAFLEMEKKLNGNS
ncbi:oxidoreductase-like protein [Chlamydoabsidia padenii]|nr:oxidoreductase-like protein [Chlamydoabsidia padenii]